MYGNNITICERQVMRHNIASIICFFDYDAQARGNTFRTNIFCELFAVVKFKLAVKKNKKRWLLKKCMISALQTATLISDPQRETSWTEGKLIRKFTQNNEAYKQSNVNTQQHNSKNTHCESSPNKHMWRRTHTHTHPTKTTMGKKRS